MERTISNATIAGSCRQGGVVNQGEQNFLPLMAEDIEAQVMGAVPCDEGPQTELYFAGNTEFETWKEYHLEYLAETSRQEKEHREKDLEIANQKALLAERDRTIKTLYNANHRNTKKLRKEMKENEAKLMAEIEKKNQDLHKVIEKNDELRINIKNSGVLVKLMEDKCKGLESALDEKSKSEALAKKQLQEALSKLQEKNQELEKRDNKLAKLKQNYDGKIGELGEANEALVSVKHELEEKKEELEELNQKYDVVKVKLGIANAEVKKANIQCVFVQDQLAKETKKVADLENELEEANKKGAEVKKALEEENKKGKEVKKKFEEKLEYEQGLNRELNSEISELKESAVKSNDEKGLLEQEIGRLKKKNYALEERVKNIREMANEPVPDDGKGVKGNSPQTTYLQLNNLN